LCSGYRVSFPAVKRRDRGVSQPSPSSVKVKERVELKFCSPSVLSLGIRANFKCTLYFRGNFVFYRNTVCIWPHINKEISFNIHRTVHRDIFLQQKPTRCTIFQDLFRYRTLHVSDRFTVHHQESNTVYTAIGMCHTGYADCLKTRSGCSILISLADSQSNLYDTYLLLCIQY